MLAIKLTPFVNSTIPESKGLPNSLGIFKMENAGAQILEKLSNKWLWFKIEITTENKTTNPPISKMVEVAFLRLVPKISPKEEKVGGVILGFVERL